MVRRKEDVGRRIRGKRGRRRKIWREGVREGKGENKRKQETVVHDINK